MDELARVKGMLHQGGYTLVLLCGEQVYTSDERGIRPLLERVLSGTDDSGGYAADRIVGRAAAMLYILLRVRAVYADVMSKDAALLLKDAGITASYGTLTDTIMNRDGTGSCPMEAATAALTDPADAPRALIAALKRLRNTGG